MRLLPSRLGWFTVAAPGYMTWTAACFSPSVPASAFRPIFR